MENAENPAIALVGVLTAGNLGIDHNGRRSRMRGHQTPAPKRDHGGAITQARVAGAHETLRVVGTPHDAHRTSTAHRISTARRTSGKSSGAKGVFSTALPIRTAFDSNVSKRPMRRQRPVLGPRSHCLAAATPDNRDNATILDRIATPDV